MNYNILKTKCVICGKPAVTTAAQILVCEEHANQYAEEGRKYLPDHQRVFWHELQRAHDCGMPNAKAVPDALTQPNEQSAGQGASWH